jgi:hypothetical protein
MTHEKLQVIEEKLLQNQDLNLLKLMVFVNTERMVLVVLRELLK